MATSTKPSLPTTLGFIAVGGAAGACLRYLFSVWIPEEPGVWPLATFIANLLGCLLMGLFLGIVTRMPATPPRLTALIATGFLGGLTTFSTYAADAVVILTDAGQGAMAIAYLLVTVVVGWVCLRFGWIVGRDHVPGDFGRPEFGPAEMGD